MHPLHSLLSIASREERLSKQCPGQPPAFVRVHLPDGFQNHLPGDFDALRQFALLVFFGRGLFVEIGLDLLDQLQPGLVLGMGVGVHQGSCCRMTGVAPDRLSLSRQVAAGLQELVGRAGMPQPMEYDIRGYTKN